MTKHPDTATDFETCHEHTGIMTWLKGIGAILCIVSGQLGYIAFSIPNLKADVAKEIARMEREDAAIRMDINTIKIDTGDLKSRVTRIESKMRL